MDEGTHSVQGRTIKSSKDFKSLSRYLTKGSPPAFTRAISIPTSSRDIRSFSDAQPKRRKLVNAVKKYEATIENANKKHFGHVELTPDGISIKWGRTDEPDSRTWRWRELGNVKTSQKGDLFDIRIHDISIIVDRDVRIELQSSFRQHKVNITGHNTAPLLPISKEKVVDKYLKKHKPKIVPRRAEIIGASTEAVNQSKSPIEVEDEDKSGPKDTEPAEINFTGDKSPKSDDTSIKASSPSSPTPEFTPRRNQPRSARTKATEALEPDLSCLEPSIEFEKKLVEEGYKPIRYTFDDGRSSSIAIHDLARLEEGKFLDDSLIMFCLKYALDDLRRREPDRAEGIRLLSTFFFTQLSSTGKVGKWKKTDLLSSNVLIMPMHGALHWSVAIIVNLNIAKEELKDSSIQELDPLKKPTIILFDSLPGTKYKANATFRQICRVCDLFFQDQGLPTIDRKQWLRVIASVPPQSNMTDCGIYLINIVEKFLKNPAAVLDQVALLEPKKNGGRNRLTVEYDKPELWEKDDLNMKRRQLLTFFKTLGEQSESPSDTSHLPADTDTDNDSDIEILS